MLGDVEKADRLDFIIEELDPDRIEARDREDVDDVAPGGKLERLVDLADPVIAKIQKIGPELRNVIAAALLKMDDRPRKIVGGRKETKEGRKMGDEDFVSAFHHFAERVEPLGHEFPRGRYFLGPEQFLAREENDLPFRKEIQKELIGRLGAIEVVLNQGIAAATLLEREGPTISSVEKLLPSKKGPRRPSPFMAANRSLAMARRVVAAHRLFERMEESVFEGLGRPVERFVDQGSLVLERLPEDIIHDRNERVLANPDITCPIVGPRTLEQLMGSVKGLDVKLDEVMMKKLDEIFPGPGGEAPEAYAW